MNWHSFSDITWADPGLEFFRWFPLVWLCFGVVVVVVFAYSDRG